MPELHSLSLSGAAEGTANGFTSVHDLDVTLSGASELVMNMETGVFTSSLSGASIITGSLRATGTALDLTGASEIKLDGAGGDISMVGSGASTFNLQDYKVNNASIDLSGASDAKLYIDGSLNASLSGASDVEYSGNPTLGNMDLSGGSAIVKRQ